MKKIIVFLFMIFASPVFAAYTVDCQNGKCGLIDSSTKQVVVPYKYDKLWKSKDYVGYIAELNGKFGFIRVNNSTEQIILTPDFDEIYDENVTKNSPDDFIVKKNGKYQIYSNTDSPKLLLKDYDAIIPANERSGDFLVKLNGKWGLMFVTSGEKEIEIPIKYDKITECSPLNYLVQTGNETFFTSLLDKNKYLPNIQIVKGFTFETGYDYVFIAKKNGKYGLISAFLTEVLPFKYDELSIEKDDLQIVFKANGKYGLLIDSFGEARVTIEPKYDSLKIASYWKYGQNIPYSYEAKLGDKTIYLKYDGSVMENDK